MKSYFSYTVLIIICAVFLCYANSLRAPFLWDDEVLILRNHYIKDFNYLPEIFTTTHFQGGGEGGNFYRPLQVFSYALDYSIWKLNPFGYHLTNLILHCLVSLAIYFLITQISTSSQVGFLSALFFAVHPVHTEAVTYIAGRADPLMALFLLFAFVCFIKASLSDLQRYIYWLMACLLYIFALLSKESALIFLALTLFYLLCLLPKKKIRPAIPIYASLLLITLAYILIRATVFDFPIDQSSLSLIAQAPLIQRLLTIPKIWLVYLGLLIFPLHLHMERHFLIISLNDAYFWLGLTVLIVTIWLFILSYRRWRVGCFYFGWFIISLIPVLNLVPLNATMAEHWLYLASIGFWALVAEAGVRFFKQSSEKSKRLILLFSCCFLLFYCLRTIMRNFQWRTPIRLYAHDLQYSPNSFILHNNLGVELFRWGEIEKAGQEFQAAVQICPRYATAHNNLGVVLEGKGEINQAIAHYQAAIELNAYILAYGNLGRVYLKINQPKKAVAILEEGRRLYPDDAQILKLLSTAYQSLERGLWKTH